MASEPGTPISHSPSADANPATRCDRNSAWDKDFTMTAIAKADESFSVTQIQKQTDANSLDSTDPKCDLKASFRLKPKNPNL